MFIILILFQIYFQLYFRCMQLRSLIACQLELAVVTFLWGSLRLQLSNNSERQWNSTLVLSLPMNRPKERKVFNCTVSTFFPRQYKITSINFMWVLENTQLFPVVKYQSTDSIMTNKHRTISDNALQIFLLMASIISDCITLTSYNVCPTYFLSKCWKHGNTCHGPW